jgi:hypothetical protein
MPSDEYVCSGWACVDCLVLLANGDNPPDWTEAEISAWHDEIDQRNVGYNVTLGLIREEHECARNFTVRAVCARSGNGRRWQPYPQRISLEFRADSESDARDQFEWEYLDNTKIISVTEHELRTAGDAGNECGCEIDSFSWSPCDYCGGNLGGERHAISFFKILP